VRHKLSGKIDLAPDQVREPAGKGCAIECSYRLPERGFVVGRHRCRRRQRGLRDEIERVHGLKIGPKSDCGKGSGNALV
jgi:hypothetical protein